MKIKTPIALSLGILLICFPPAGGASTCAYTYKPDELKVGWPAYKTTARVPVSGEFTGIVVHGVNGAQSMEDHLMKTEIQLNLLSSTTGRAMRDMNLLNSFFSAIANNTHVVGRVVSVSPSAADPAKGDLVLELGLNGLTKNISMTYVVSPENIFRAAGSLQMPEFALDASLKMLDLTCHESHKGADGVSKVFSDVDISITVPLQMVCPS